MEKTRFKSYLNESANDIGIFKAIFIGGIPGAGKSYTIDKITDGSIQPRIVNTDKFTEFLAHQAGVSLSKNIDKEIKRSIVDKSKILTKKQLFNYINGMLPLLVDGTSNNIGNILRRKGQLESVGYDTGMIWIYTSLETALKRARERDRYVDEDFIKDVFNLSEENKEFFQKNFEFFEVIDNNDGMLTDSIIKKAYSKTKSFYSGKIENPAGRRRLEKMQEDGEKYLIPTVYDETSISNVVASWYFTQ